MKIPIFDRIFSIFGEERQREKLMLILRQYFFENPVAIAAVILAGISLLVSLFTGRMPEMRKRRANWVCLFGYYAALILLLVFSRYWQGDVRGIRGFEIGYYLTENGFHEGNVLIIAVNALVFVPFGSLLRKAAVSWRSGLLRSCGRAAAPVSALLQFFCVLAAGLLVEVLQLLFARGYFAAIDIAAYTAGSVVGILFMGIVLRISARRENRKTSLAMKRGEA